MLTRFFLLLDAVAGSAALLLGALAFQYLGGLAPCHLCVLQRWPHLAAIVIGLAAMRTRGPLLPVLGLLAVLTTAGIGLYHTAVERHWVAGPQSCTSGSLDTMTAEELLRQLEGAALVQCDQVAWSLLGLSMASWNAILSLLLAVTWAGAALRSRPEAV